MSLKDTRDPFDPEQLRLEGEYASRSQHRPDRTKLPRHQQGETFLKGPIPMIWLSRAAQLPGKALHVGLALWQRAGLEKRGDILLTNALCEAFAVDRFAKQRALAQLEQAGLIQVERTFGKNPRVILLGVSPPRGDAP